MAAPRKIRRAVDRAERAVEGLVQLLLAEPDNDFSPEELRSMHYCELRDLLKRHAEPEATLDDLFPTLRWTASRHLVPA